MKKLILSMYLILCCFNASSNENAEKRTDRLATAAKAIFSKVLIHFDPAFVTLAGLEKCNVRDGEMVRLKTFLSMDGKEYKGIVNSKIIEMSKDTSSSICLSHSSCNDDVYLVLNILELMKTSYVASSISTMRLVDTNAKYCNQIRKAAIHILNQKKLKINNHKY
jgi:hypothetical protein